jgi:hypothetical protein
MVVGEKVLRRLGWVSPMEAFSLRDERYYLKIPGIIFLNPSNGPFPKGTHEP